MTERERTSTSRANEQDAATPDDGVEVFDASGAIPTAGHSGAPTNLDPRNAHSASTATQYTEHRTSPTASTGQGSNSNWLLTIVAIIILVALLLYWIF